MDYILQPFYERIAKPWGYELLLTPKDSERTGKILHINGGSRLSFQYHETKEEVMVLISGKAVIWLEDAAGEVQKIPMELKKGYWVKPLQKHRVEALEDSEIFEISSPEKGTTYRLEDDFTRPDETESLRAQPNRGWQ